VLTVKFLEDLPRLAAPLHLALGVFDGVHVGHQAVISRAVNAAKRDGGLAGVLTFDPHPIRVIAPNKAPSALLATLEHKATVVQKLGVTLFIPLHFDADFAKMEASEFIAKLSVASLKTLAVGEDWRFGHDRSGDVKFLQQESQRRGFTLEAVPPVMHDGDRISSTRIRQAIRDGNLTAAEQMLGRPYTLIGTVVEGQKLGRTLGFPTANLATGEGQLPPNGVWAVTAMLNDSAVKQGVANLGLRPTVGGLHQVLEIHLLDHQEDLYGQNLEIRFEKYLRPEVKFSSVEQLRQQIATDVEVARNYFSGKNAGL
jgi:riboflavin kinase / FMN adenylyltransferase